jgi:Flp pilus assembly protein TadG
VFADTQFGSFAAPSSANRALISVPTSAACTFNSQFIPSQQPFCFQIFPHSFSSNSHLAENARLNSIFNPSVFSRLRIHFLEVFSFVHLTNCIPGVWGVSPVCRSGFRISASDHDNCHNQLDSPRSTSCFDRHVAEAETCPPWRRPPAFSRSQPRRRFVRPPHRTNESAFAFVAEALRPPAFSRAAARARRIPITLGLVKISKGIPIALTHVRSQASNNPAGGIRITSGAAGLADANNWLTYTHLETREKTSVKPKVRTARILVHNRSLHPPQMSPIAHSVRLFAAGGSSANSARRRSSERIATKRKRESGQTLVLVAGALLLILLPIMGLGIDFGYFRYQQAQLQTAADAAAIAAAGELSYSVSCSCNALQAAGQDASAANGFTNGANGATVSVNNPPQDSRDPNNGNLNFVEVVITQTEPTFFAKALGVTSITLGARAEAAQSTNGAGVLAN